MKKLSAFLFLPWLFLGISWHLSPPGNAGDIALNITIHILFLTLLWLIARKAGSRESGSFMGYSSGVWIGGSAATYALGLLIPVIA